MLTMATQERAAARRIDEAARRPDHHPQKRAAVRRLNDQPQERAAARRMDDQSAARRMDDQSFRAVCWDHVPPLLGYVTRLTFGDRHAAEDVVQETLLRAWQHPEVLHSDRASTRPWLFAVARNLVIDRRRAKSKRPTEVNDAALASTPSPVDGLEAALTSWTVKHALAKLSADHRMVLVEVYYRARSVAETAERLGLPVGTVKSRTYYALRALRLALQESGVFPVASG
jgi:RNA polymerase sigma-70 factor (ECF subfamily)